MRSLRLRRLSLLLCCVPCSAVQAVTIDHKAVACVVAGRFPRLDARLAPAPEVARARVFFHADDDARWYYVDMKAEAGAFHGVLPAPLKSTKRIHYYIETTDKSVAQARTQEYAATVVPDAGACGNQGMVAAIAVASKVMVGAPAGAAAAPAGFAANTVAVAGGAAGGGIGATALVIGGVALAGGAVAVKASQGSQEETGSQAAPPGDSLRTVALEGTVYNDRCCGTGLISAGPKSGPRVPGAVVSWSLDSKTATTDAQGHFLLETQVPRSRCEGQATFTVTIVAAGCDTVVEGPKQWGCSRVGESAENLNLLCR